MNKRFLIIFCVLIATTSLAIAQEDIHNEKITIKKDGVLSSQTILVEYPILNQARINNITFEIINIAGSASTLRISGRIQNMLKRDLINAEVIIEFFDTEKALINTLQKKAVPNSIKQENRFGTFSIETPFSEKMSSCKINIIWQGKK